MKNIFDIKNNKTYLDLDSAERLLEVLIDNQRRNQMLDSELSCACGVELTKNNAYKNNALIKVFRMLFSILKTDEEFNNYIDNQFKNSRVFEEDGIRVELTANKFQDYTGSPSKIFGRAKDFSRVVISYNENTNEAKSIIIEVNERSDEKIFNLYFKNIKNNYDDKYLKELVECENHTTNFLAPEKTENIKNIEKLNIIARENKNHMGRIYKRKKDLTILELENTIKDEIKKNIHIN